MREINLKFICPRCGSTYFRSEPIGADHFRRFCKRCQFTFTDHEDYKYFYEAIGFENGQQVREAAQRVIDQVTGQDED